MRKFLIDITKTYIESEEGHAQLANYYDMRNHAGWKAHQTFMMLLIEKIGNEMLSTRFTKLDAQKKDIEQRVYNSMYEVLRFLIDPLKMAESTRKIQKHNKQMEATLPGATRKDLK
jgi:hypothetical protein